MALRVLTYNLTRVMNIVGIKPLMAAIVTRPDFNLCSTLTAGQYGQANAPALPSSPNRKNVLEAAASHRLRASRPLRPPSARCHTTKTQKRHWWLARSRGLSQRNASHPLATRSVEFVDTRS